MKGEGLGDSPGSKLIEVGKHGGAARATLEPNEKWGLGEMQSGVLGFIEGVENCRSRSRVDWKVTRPAGVGFFGE